MALTIQTFVVKMMSLLFNMLSRFVTAFLDIQEILAELIHEKRSKHLLIAWLQSPSAVILEPKDRKFWSPRKEITICSNFRAQSPKVSAFSLSICHEMIGLDAMIFVF